VRKAGVASLASRGESRPSLRIAVAELGNAAIAIARRRIEKPPTLPRELCLRII
jgi:hypothetical protein